MPDDLKDKQPSIATIALAASASAPSTSTFMPPWVASSPASSSAYLAPIVTGETFNLALNALNLFFRQLRALIRFGCYEGGSTLKFESYKRQVPRGLATIYGRHLSTFHGCHTLDEAYFLLGEISNTLVSPEGKSSSFFSSLMRKDDTNNLYNLLIKIHGIFAKKTHGWQNEINELTQTFKFFNTNFVNDSCHELIINSDLNKTSTNKILAFYSLLSINKLEITMSDLFIFDIDFNSLRMFISEQLNCLTSLVISPKIDAGDASSIHAAIQFANTLSEALVGNVALTQLRFCNLSLMAASSLLEKLPILPMLTHLDLSKNSINYPFNTSNSKYLENIIVAALKQPVLKEINLDGCGIFNDFAKVILHELQQAEHVSHLPQIILTNNPIKKDTLSAIEDHIKRHNQRAPRDVFDPSNEDQSSPSSSY